MNHLRARNFLHLASQIEEDPDKKAKLRAAVRLLEQKTPNITREVTDGERLRDSEHAGMPLARAGAGTEL